ncbi:MAG: DUF4097 family beta strand repeat-containing protein [Bryobacteraceae bacterium]
MKKLIATTFLAAMAAGSLRAQDQTKVAFPNPGQPRKLVVDSMMGSVTVRGYDGQEVIIETSGGRSPARKRTSEPPPGMHRIGSNGGDVNITTQDNTIRINGNILSGPANMTIQVPVQTSVTVKTLSGKELLIENINGEIEANNMNGNVQIVNVSGSVVAHSMNGKVTASLNTVMPDKAMSFSSFNGDVDVTLPGGVKANVKLKTDRGDMFTDFDIKLDPTSPPTVTADKNAKKTRVRSDRSTTGSINGGGPEIQFTSYNGDIVIHKK